MFDREKKYFDLKEDLNGSSFFLCIVLDIVCRSDRIGISLDRRDKMEIKSNSITLTEPFLRFLDIGSFDSVSMLEFKGDSHMIRRMVLSVTDDIVNNMVQFHMSSTVVGEIIDTVRLEVSYPNGVWQTFKDRWAPEWFKRWFPVKLRTKFKEEDVWATMPEFKKAFPKERVHFCIVHKKSGFEGEEDK